VVPLTMSAAGEFPSAVKASGGKLTGTVTAVADAAAADTLVVPALGEDGPALYAVHARDVTVTNEIPLDLTRGIATVELSDVDGHVLAERNRAVAALRTALRTGAGILASEQLGLAQWCLDTTVRYLKERHQFGRPVGSFQALKHRLADVYLELVTARAAARYAADELARAGSDVAVAVALAASYCGQVAVHAAEEALQMHGGIGMTWEHPVHLYLKRAKSDQLALGTPGGHRAELAELVDLPA
ncbi:MAG: acyl-CoA dehydrogenase family protein, partial [Sciscionella sp.]